MLRRLLAVLTLCIGSLFTAQAVQAAKAADEAVLTSVKGRYDDVRASLVAAIEGRGLVITYTAHIGDMLERTGKDIGSARKIYEKAEAFEFCSASISRNMMEAAAANIVNCPYAVFVYALPGDPGKTILAYRRPMRGLVEVEKLLRSIVAEAAGN